MSSIYDTWNFVSVDINRALKAGLPVSEPRFNPFRFNKICCKNFEMSWVKWRTTVAKIHVFVKSLRGTQIAGSLLFPAATIDHLYR